MSIPGHFRFRTCAGIVAKFSLLVLLLPNRARAQSESDGIGVSFDAVWGRGQRTQYNGTTWFSGSSTPYGRASLGITGPAIHRVRPLLTLDYSLAWVFGDYVDLRSLAPDGSCVQRFSGVAGQSVGVGVRAAPLSWADISVTVGSGNMAGTSRHLDADVALRLATRVRLLAGVRYIVMRPSEGDRLWWRPLTAGLRIQ